MEGVCSQHQLSQQPAVQFIIRLNFTKHCLLLHFPFLQKAYVPHSISRTADTRSSTHHWQWSTSCSGQPLVQSTSMVPSLHWRHSSSHQPGHVTAQSQQSEFQLEFSSVCLIHLYRTTCLAYVFCAFSCKEYISGSQVSMNKRFLSKILHSKCNLLRITKK